jgi:predicted amidohydrolase
VAAHGRALMATRHGGSGLRVGIAQQPMEWTAAENLRHIRASLAQAAARNARICVFPELALTGFHRRIRDQSSLGTVAGAMRQVQEECCKWHIACALGTPTFGPDGAILNSYVIVAGDGSIASVASKVGLTPSEQTFFRAGTTRELVEVESRRCTTVMCREVDDVDSIERQLASDVIDVVFWPSLVGHPPGTVHPSPEDTADLGYVERTAVLARRLEAYVVQSNWPHALNTPGSTHHGESKVYAPDGEILLTLPRDTPGVAVMVLGERDYDWTPAPT